MIRAIKKTYSESITIDFRKCIAKTEFANSEIVPGMTAYDHAVLTGAVAMVLFEKLHIEKYGILKEDAVLLAALHDVGKISAPFQCKTCLSKFSRKSSVKSPYSHQVFCLV